MHMELNKKSITWMEYGLILIGSLHPIFFNLPYKDNIFLAYEGAYRMYLGQLPFKDFYLPLGYGMWIIPAIFFKIFGPYLITLVKAQALINIIAGISFREILKYFKVEHSIRLFSVLIFCVTYIFINRWPWYNHTVIVFEFVGVVFLLHALESKSNFKTLFFLFTASFFSVLAFITKQDGGAFAILLNITLILYIGIVRKRISLPALYLGMTVISILIFILPLLPYNFSYWFNYGQPPHYSRISLFDFINEFLKYSMWVKLYLLVISIIIIYKFQYNRKYLFNERNFMFALFTLFILFQATILQVTSYTPPDGSIYFHSFAFAFIFFNISTKINFSKLPYFAIMTVFLMLLWSGSYWQYFERPVKKLFPQKDAQADRQIISKNTFLLDRDSTYVDYRNWITSNIQAFKKVEMPPSTIEGMNRLLSMPLINKPDLKFLNMTELTPLAFQIGYNLEKNKPLWYHYGVSIFEEQIEDYIKEIKDQYYDIVLYEYKPRSNNFYPFIIREVLQKEYYLIDNFSIPRKEYVQGDVIEVYLSNRHVNDNYKISTINN